MTTTIEPGSRTALITGAARGIGRACALALAADGWNIVATDVAAPVAGTTYDMASNADLEQTVADVAAQGVGAISQAVDVREVDQLRQAVAAGVREFGSLNAVVANAGVASWPETTWQATEEQWQTMIDVVLTGSWNTARVAIPALQEAGGGSIVFIGSTAAVKPLPTIGHYAAAKFGLVGLTKSLALEVASQWIRVNIVHPGGTATFMTQNAQAEQWQATAPGVSGALELPLPIHRMEPIDIGNAVAWLSSDEARYLTGTELVIDAGATLR